jgi:hypothetical protein
LKEEKEKEVKERTKKDEELAVGNEVCARIDFMQTRTSLDRKASAVNDVEVMVVMKDWENCTTKAEKVVRKLVKGVTTVVRGLVADAATGSVKLADQEDAFGAVTTIDQFRDCFEEYTTALVKRHPRLSGQVREYWTKLMKLYKKVGLNTMLVFDLSQRAENSIPRDLETRLKDYGRICPMRWSETLSSAADGRQYVSALAATTSNPTSSGKGSGGGGDEAKRDQPTKAKKKMAVTVHADASGQRCPHLESPSSCTRGEACPFEHNCVIKSCALNKGARVHSLNCPRAGASGSNNSARRGRGGNVQRGSGRSGRGGRGGRGGGRGAGRGRRGGGPR